MMHLNAFVMPNGHHEAAWRHPSTDPHRARTLQHYVDTARTGDHICYYSDLRQMKAHYPAWDITKTLDDTIGDIVTSWRDRLTVA